MTGLEAGSLIVEVHAADALTVDADVVGCDDIVVEYGVGAHLILRQSGLDLQKHLLKGAVIRRTHTPPSIWVGSKV